MIAPEAPRLICVGTHHKTGTIWMQTVFKRISRDLSIFSKQVRPRAMAEVPAGARAILVNWSSAFPAELRTMSDARFLHMIRDPRDVLISGAKYHLTAPVRGEKFLHVPRDDLGGLTYQQHLNALPDDLSRLRFEMENKHLATLREMLAWDYGDPAVFELRYETLIRDESCAIFTDALRFLGFDGEELETCRDIFWRNSLFGGLREGRSGRVAGHVNSGAVAQWKRKLPLEIAEEYRDRHGDDLIALGYECDKNWLDEITEAAA
ncbi:hypothetical protein DDZ14_18005 [Maritimibacter sp. 55A14]|uniref:hypothetical protein n=1 Tax=Maritimibacter sp. 55A14 TaxID=2174844 RepID=UPI000D61A5A9|nr:hypothetical protein [Maritimibacter sp. 55A14]PWE29264.1 hypothetical protein DDZ14_18005 [Maritimibacter sp. 55A14]